MREILVVLADFGGGGMYLAFWGLAFGAVFCSISVDTFLGSSSNAIAGELGIKVGGWPGS